MSYNDESSRDLYRNGEKKPFTEADRKRISERIDKQLNNDYKIGDYVPGNYDPNRLPKGSEVIKEESDERSYRLKVVRIKNKKNDNSEQINMFGGFGL